MAGDVNIELVEKYLPYVDEQFTTESKTARLTNNDFDFVGAHTVKIYKVGVGAMTDYARNGGMSRYGTPKDLDATTETLMLGKDRSFTFVIDKLDEDETAGNLASATALARQIRQVVIPEVDTHVLSKICVGAGHKPEGIELTNETIYDEIFNASKALDDAEAPENNRILVVTPETLRLMKMSKDTAGRYQDIVDAVLDEEKKAVGIVGNIDGMDILKIPANRLPEDFGFMVLHPCATVAPMKLESYKVHQDPPGISGSLIEGRIVYDAFVLDNKKKAIYYQAKATK